MPSNEDGGEGGNQPTQETVLIFRKDNKKIETVTVDQYKNRGCWKRIRKRMCSSHRFKNLQVILFFFTHSRYDKILDNLGFWMKKFNFLN